MRATYPIDGRCHNAEPGTFNHECGKLAEWTASTLDGNMSGFCARCRDHGAERHAFVTWTPLSRQTALAFVFQRADDEWHNELVKVFGKRAGLVRYTKEGKGLPGTYLRFLSDKFDAARDAWSAVASTK